MCVLVDPRTRRTMAVIKACQLLTGDDFEFEGIDESVISVRELMRRRILSIFHVRVPSRGQTNTELIFAHMQI